MMGGWILLGLVALFVAILLARAAAFTPRERTTVPAVDVSVRQEAIAAHMQAMVRCKTVSYHNAVLEDEAEFEAFTALLREVYPNVESACGQQAIGRRGLLYHWKGRSSDRPSVLMAHYDVVPAEASQWSKPPFEGIIGDGHLWGRGTLDTKCTLLSIMEAAEQLLSEGFVPAQDIYLCFGGNEEIGGGGAVGLVDALRARGVQPAFVLDEGGAIVEKVFPGVRQPAALIGISEKGQMNATLRVRSQGGHASAPPPHTPVGILARAVTRVEARPFPFTMTKAARALFDTLGRHSTFGYRVLFANLWCFAPLLNWICKKSGGEMNALVRTTCAFTQMSASDAPNVMPPIATVGANLRLIGGDTRQTVLDALTARIADPQVEVTIDDGSEPAPDSCTEGEPWERLLGAISQSWPGVLASPYLMVAASDSRRYAQISDAVYRFCPMPLSGEQRKLIHGNDERIPLDTLYDMVAFYVRLIRAS